MKKLNITAAKELKKEKDTIYNNILNFPAIVKYPERKDDLKNKIKQLADMDHISYQVALEQIWSAFLTQYLETLGNLETNPNDNNFRKIETATNNLFLLKDMECLDYTTKDLLG